MKILMYAKAPDATEFYRIKIPAKYLQRQGHEVRFGYPDKMPKVKNSGIKAEDLTWADIILFQRPVTPVVLNIIDHIRKTFPHKPVIADYDDDYYSVPRWNPGYPHLKIYEKSWKATVPKFDGIITSTDTLNDVMSEKTDAEVVTIPNGFDFDMFDELTPMDPVGLIAPSQNKEKFTASYTLETDQFNEICQDRTVCCWAGSKFHYCDLDWLPDDLSEVCKKTDDIIFLFVGYIQGNIVKSVPINRLFTSRGYAPISEFYRFLKSVKIDIMLAPLDPCDFNMSKSNIKLLEAFSLKGPYPLCSALDPYEEDLDPALYEDGEMDDVHGRLVSYEKGSWAKAIMETAEELKDPSFKKRVAMENEAYVRATHSAEFRTEDYINFFERMISKRSK